MAVAGHSPSSLPWPAMVQGQEEEEEEARWRGRPCQGKQLPVPAASAGERALERDQEPGWLAGRRRQSASPAECRDLARAQLGRLLFFYYFFSPPGQLIPSIFNELPQVAQ